MTTLEIWEEYACLVDAADNDPSRWTLAGWWNAKGLHGHAPNAYFPRGGRIHWLDWQSTFKTPGPHQALLTLAVWDPTGVRPPRHFCRKLHCHVSAPTSIAAALSYGDCAVDVPAGYVVAPWISAYGPKPNSGLPFSGSPLEVQCVLGVEGEGLIRYLTELPEGA